MTITIDRDQTLRGLIPEDLIRFSWLEEIAQAPDGRQVAYTVRRPDVEHNGYRTDAYLLDIESGVGRKLTNEPGMAGALAWSRDGARLAYVWRDQDKSGIQIVSAEGAPERSYLVSGPAPAELDWSPDGTRLACSRWTELRRDEPQGVRAGIPAPTIRVVTRLRYKMDGVGWVESSYRQIWLLELSTGDFTPLTDDECDYSQPRWSWDGRRLAFTCATREMDVPMGHGQIVICDLAGGEGAPMISGWQGIAHCAQWRADDKAIVFTGHNESPPVNNRIFSHIWICDLQTGQARDLSFDKDEEVGNYCVADQRAALTNITVKWPEGKGPIYFLLTEKGACQLYSTTEAGGCQLEAGGQSVHFEYSPATKGRIVCGMGDPSNPGDLYLLAHGASRRLTNLNPWLNSRKLSAPQEYWYDGVDGAKIHAWIIKPVDFRGGKRYPAVLEVHCSQFSWDFCLEFQCLAAAGYVVAYFNQRGTTAGYGQAWTRASEGDQGGQDYEEIMLGVDDLVGRPYVDAARLGVTGGSCGGFLTNWIIGHTDRFKAAVTQRSISNEISCYGTSDLGPEMIEGETEATPWTDLAKMWKQSPLAYADKIHTPLLILHATEDHRCPLEQAEQLFAALRWLRREVEMVIFVGENHGLTRGGLPGNRIEHLRRIVGWFRKYLGASPTF